MRLNGKLSMVTINMPTTRGSNLLEISNITKAMWMTRGYINGIQEVSNIFGKCPPHMVHATKKFLDMKGMIL